MTLKRLVIPFSLFFFSMPGFSDSTADAALGGGIGGALGAALGNEIGGRDGAILGGAIGGATGAAIASDRDKDRRAYYEYREPPRYEYREPTRRHNKGSFCPPGQRKKGRC